MPTGSFSFHENPDLTLNAWSRLALTPKIVFSGHPGAAFFASPWAARLAPAAIIASSRRARAVLATMAPDSHQTARKDLENHIDQTQNEGSAVRDVSRHHPRADDGNRTRVFSLGS